LTADIQLIVGLGNPGPEYDKTRHNAGAWLVQRLADQAGETFRAEKKFQGLACKTKLEGRECKLFLPTTYMNHSGQAVKAIANFYKIPAESILVAHDELDLPCGEVRLKQNGGHGGHNGLRDIINHLGGKQFFRLRLGIGHPGHSDDVVDYVLHPPSRSELQKIEIAVDTALAHLPILLAGDDQKAMKELHTGT